MAGSRRSTSSYYIVGSVQRLSSHWLLPAFLAATLALFAQASLTSAGPDDYLMCGWSVAERTQTVWIDPDLAGSGVTRTDVLIAFESWNQLFVKYHDRAIFVEHRGSPFEADIVITARGSERTWVQTPCTPGSLSQGIAHSTVYLGWRDAWRNREMLPHELGHTLGLADHGTDAQRADDHVGFRLCDGSYMGVMSYCTSKQSWFLDIATPDIMFDGGLVAHYW